MKKALRIGYNQYYDDKLFAKHLAFIKENISVIDEITLFTEFSHYGYRDLNTTKENALLLKDRIKQYRTAGVKSVGVNLLCTMGHWEEGWDIFPKAPFPYLVNENGIASLSCLCPANQDFLEHTAKRYALYANIGADFIWMDDDIRPIYHGIVKEYCFCSECLEAFNRENRTSFTREELVEQIRTNPQIADAWEQREYRVMLTLFETIKKAIHTANPAIEIGYMSIPHNAYPEWIEKSGAKRLRPGGGFYSDERPIDLFEKAFNVQYQISICPKDIQDIQYEYEAFNYQTLERSMHLSELETSLSLISGCNGVLYNDDIFYDRQQTVIMLQRSVDKWNTLNRVNSTCSPAGVYCKNVQIAKAFNEISIPVTPYFENSVAAVLMGADLDSMSDSDIRNALQKHLLTDGAGVEVLYKRGFGDFCGGRIKSVYDNGMAERFCDHPVNGEYAHYYRDVFMHFIDVRNHSDDAYEFEPSDEAEILSNLETVTHIPVGCSMYKFETPSGFRFAADGYLFPNTIKTAPKREQLGNLIDWLSGNQLPVRIKDAIKIIPTVTTDSHGGMNMMLTNASFDPSGSFTCVVRNPREFYAIGPSGQLLPIQQTHTAEETMITIENLPAWDYILLTNQS